MKLLKFILLLPLALRGLVRHDQAREPKRPKNYRVRLPLVASARPGSVTLTNQQIEGLL